MRPGRKKYNPGGRDAIWKEEMQSGRKRCGPGGRNEVVM